MIDNNEPATLRWCVRLGAVLDDIGSEAEWRLDGRTCLTFCESSKRDRCICFARVSERGTHCEEFATLLRNPTRKQVRDLLAAFLIEMKGQGYDR